MSGLLAFSTTIGFVLGSAAALKAVYLQQLRGSLVAYRLQFPRNLEESGAVSFLAGMTGLLLPWWKRWLGAPFVTFEVRANEGGIEHWLFVPAAWSPTVENLLQAHTPAIRYEQVDDERAAPRLVVGGEYRLSSGQRTLRVDAAALSVRLLTSLQPLRRDEMIVVQWTVTPSGPVAPARVAAANERQQTWLRSRSGVVPTAEEATALREKQSSPLLLGVVRIGTAARSIERARGLIRQVEAAWHSTRAPGVHLRRRMLGEGHAVARLRGRVVPLLLWPGIYNAQELSGLLGWPIGVEQVAGLVLGSSRVLAPSPLIPSTGTVIGTANFPGIARPVALDVEGRLRHVHVLGPTGVGKSTLLLNMLEQDLAAGRGVVCVDFKGDLITDLLDRVPNERRDDVVVLDPADDSPVGLNPLLSVDGPHGEVVVENLVGLLRALFAANWGPRSDDLVRGSLRTLVASGNYTLCEVAPLLLDASFRRRLVAQLDDPSLQEFWGWYDNLSNAERVSITAAPLNKLRSFVMRPAARAIVGQARPAIAMRDVLADKKVLLVSLAAGLLGTEAAALLGALVFSELWHSTLARAGMPAARRHAVMAYLDEFQEVVRLPVPMASVLAEARGLGVGFVLAHQHAAQLDTELRNAVLANARSRVVFQVAAQDARLLARELGGGLTPDDLQGLGAYEIAAQVYAAGRTQPPLTASTSPPTSIRTNGALIRGRSRQHYGVPRKQVEAEIRERQESRPDAPIGRRRRRESP